EVGQESQTTAIAFENIAYLVAFIAVNLAVMNLLPIPALDGGRIFFLLINTIAEKIFKKKINPKYEGYIHAAGMVLLLGLMAFVLVNDVIKIVR
ncbi:MAG: site-2 protease family protein, partial [Oscillospiraceae bacterium]|nr:site-2 protease family protein [Oscillospiraceae bacterium]